jgi:hypothetical protein
MEAVDCLGRVRHRDFIRVPVEENGRVQRIAKCQRLAEQIRRGDFLTGMVPDTPFVYN